MTENLTLDELVDRVLAEPSDHLAQADEISSGLPDWQAQWLRGLALREVGRFREAEQALTLAATLAEDVGSAAVARVRSSRSIVLVSLGDAEAALADADWAAAHLRGGPAGRNESQRGIILFRLGRHQDGLDACARAEPLLEAAGDERALARLHGNRAAIHAIVGDLEAARDFNRKAARIYRRTGNRLGIGIAEHNLGFLEGRSGDIPAALSHFDAARALLVDIVGPARLAVSSIDRAEVLADAGLFVDALDHVEEAIAALKDERERIVLAEAELLAARLLASLHRFDEAEVLAGGARVELEQLQKSGWAAKARWIEVTARRLAGKSFDPEAAADLARELAEAGWPLESMDVLLAGVDASVDTGNLVLARKLVGRLRKTERDVPALLQVGRHRAIARTRAAGGDRAGARRAITAGLKLLHEHRLSFGSAELRAHAARHGQGLFEVAIQLALDDDRPDDALVTLDLLRDTERPIWSRPPSDATLASDLATLRRLDGDLRDAAREGTDVPEAERSRVSIERRIRERLRGRPGAAGPAERLDVAALRTALAGRSLRSWFVHGDTVGAVVLDRKGRRLELLGSADAITAEVEAWRFAMRRLADGRGNERQLGDAAKSAAAAAERLVGLLGLEDHPEGDDLVVVPTAILRGLAWHALPVLRNATVSIVPSARYWLRQVDVARVDGSTVAAAGPGLTSALHEVHEIAAKYADGTALSGPAATAHDVVAALDGASIGHLAAHGTFRWDNPLFSALQFEDGPVWLHDFERLRAPPATLVLSSCDMAMDRAVAGDAVVGMASGLLRLGVRTLIAPVVPVADEEVAAFMIALHERMAAGSSGGEALAAIAATWSHETSRQQAVAQSFVSFGV